MFGWLHRPGISSKDLKVRSTNKIDSTMWKFCWRTATYTATYQKRGGVHQPLPPPPPCTTVRVWLCVYIARLRVKGAAVVSTLDPSTRRIDLTSTARGEALPCDLSLLYNFSACVQRKNWTVVFFFFFIQTYTSGFKKFHPVLVVRYHPFISLLR